MKVRAVFSLLVVLAGLLPAARADEPPHATFVRGLRERQMPDLALEYLQALKSTSPAMAPVLALEQAKCRLDLASREPTVAKRQGLQDRARAEFQAFLQTYPEHPLAAEARLEVARILEWQGRSRLGRSRQLDGKDAQRAELLAARSQFEEAGRLLQDAVARADGAIKAIGDKDLAARDELARAKLQGELDLGVNLLHQAMTYVDQSELVRHGELVKLATQALKTVSGKDSSAPLCWQAEAWLGRCHQENDDPKAARKVFADVLAERNEAADSGKRLARYFRMLTLARDPDVKNPPAAVQQAGEEWLRLYPEFVNTPEGAGVRFELANACLAQATAAPKTQQQSKRVQDLYTRAQKLYQGLEQGAPEFAARARENRLAIILTLSQERSKGDIGKLRDFEECFLRAQAEAARLNEASHKLSGDKLEAERKQRLADMVSALNRAVSLANTSVSAEDLGEAKYLLAYAYLATGDFRRAAETGEQLARAGGDATHAPAAGAYALRAYASLIAASQARGDAAEEVAGLKMKLTQLAGFIEKTWPADAAADAARHMQAVLLLGEKKWAEAVDVLERITPSYADAPQALYQLATAAYQAQKEDAPRPAGKPTFQERAIAALERMPEITAAADPATVRAYFGGRLLLADVYYRAKQFEKMEALADALTKRLADLDDTARKEQRANALTVLLYAKLGRAERDFAAGRYQQARATLAPVVKQIQELAANNELGPLKEKDPRVVRGVLGLALRSSVQDNRVAEGKDILDLLQKTFPENSLENMVLLVQQLRDQIEQLRRQGEPAKDRLEKTVANFSLFLDELTRQYEKDPKPQVILFLAQSYSSLDNHKKAAELARSIEPPRPEAGKSEPAAEAVQSYNLARVLYVRELRLNNELDEAEATLKGVAGTPWGERSLEVKKEQILLLEARGKYSLPGRQGAIYEWDKLMRSLKPRIQDDKVREQYFDCYYHFAVCLYRHALQNNDPARRTRDLRGAANYIVRLEAQQDPLADACRKRFEALLAHEPPLKEQYDVLKKANPK